MLLISIPKPCHENWNGMSPQDKGRFCQVCSKTVVDFTSLSDEQVKNYFLQQSGQKTCGRFRSDQLTNADNLLPRLLQSPIPFWKKFLAIVLILFGSLLTSCNDDRIGKLKLPMVGEAEPVYSTAGVVLPDIIPDTLKTVVIETTECTMEKGEIVGVLVPDTTMPVIVEDPICPDPPVDSIAVPVNKKLFDQHGREILEKSKRDIPEQ